MDERLDDYLEGLRSEGWVDSAGAFTIDPARALDKLRLYRLPGPAHYVLCWVRAAVWSEAAAAVVYVGPGETRMAFSGHPIGSEELKMLNVFLLDAQQSPQHRRLRQLAQGIQGFFQGGGRFVEIQAGASACRFRPGALEGEIFQAKESLPPGHLRILAKRTMSVDVARRAFERLQSLPLAEVGLLRSLCVYAPMALSIQYENATRLDGNEFGFYGGRGPFLRRGVEIELTQPGFAVAGEIKGQGMGSVQFVIGGVQTPPRTVPHLLGLRAVVWASLPLDLSQADLVAGPEYEVIMDALEDIYARALARLLLIPEERAACLETALAKLTELMRKSDLSSREAAMLATLEKDPLFPLLAGPPEDPHIASLAELRAAARLYCIERPNSQLGSDPDALLLHTPNRDFFPILALAGLRWHDEEALLRRSEGLPAFLLSASECQQAVRVYFGGGRRDGERLIFATEKTESLVLDLEARVISGPDTRGKSDTLPFAEIDRIIVDERFLLEKRERYFFVLIAAGTRTLLYDEGYHEFEAIPQSQKQSNARAISAIHGLPGLLGKEAALARPDLVAGGDFEDFLQPSTRPRRQG